MSNNLLKQTEVNNITKYRFSNVLYTHNKNYDKKAIERDLQILNNINERMNKRKAMVNSDEYKPFNLGENETLNEIKHSLKIKTDKLIKEHGVLTKSVLNIFNTELHTKDKY